MRIRPTLPRVLALFLLLGVLGGCDTPPSREPFPKLTYGHLAPFRLAVGKVEVIDAYRPPLAPPNVDQDFPVSPADTAVEWAHDRLQVVGGPDRAVFTVLRADAVDIHIGPANSGGMLSDFTVPQSDRYDLNIAVRLQILDPGGRVRATVNADATRSHTAPADATLNDRERLWFKMTDQAMKDLNASLEKGIPTYLHSWLR